MMDSRPQKYNKFRMNMARKIMFYLKVSVFLIISPLLHQLFHLAHLALEEAVDAKHLIFTNYSLP